MVIKLPAWLRIIVAITACCGCLGCGRTSGKLDRPPTVPVTGTVRLHDGAPLPKGFVQVDVVDGPPLTVSGVVEDGRFSLTTMFENAVLSGVVPGRYRFTVVPAFSAEPAIVGFNHVYEIGGSGTTVVLDVPAK